MHSASSGRAASRHPRSLGIERICAGGQDARELRIRLIGELHRWITFDYYAFLLTDPVTGVGTSPLADVPRLDQLPRLIRWKYLSTVNRWTDLDRPVATLAQATGGDLDRSALWHELQAEDRVSDVASLVFRDAYGIWGFLDLWRCDGSVFDAADLDGIAEPITVALRRSQQLGFGPVAPQAPRPGPVVLTLSSELHLIGETPHTRDHLRVLVPPATGAEPIPASAYNVAAQLLANEAGVSAEPPSARVHFRDAVWLTLRAARMGSDSIAVTIEDSGRADRLDMFARVYALSARERELVENLVLGVDTREAAARMFVSAHTVQDHLKSIFAKCGAHSRREVLAAILGS